MMSKVLVFGGVGILVALLVLVVLPTSPPVEAAAPEDAKTESIQWKFGRNAEGLLTSLTDPSGRTTHLDYQFHPNKRLKKLVRRLPDGSKVVFEFDRFGRRVSMTDRVGSTSF